ncbi:hypothetical protein FB639_005348 [Coemansia asiatica]|nr:hypothetical protein FB639_005348 [Coemansia asiatica]
MVHIKTKDGFVYRPRLFDRDIAATINMKHILLGLRNDGVIPERFRRGKPAAPAANSAMSTAMTAAVSAAVPLTSKRPATRSSKGKQPAKHPRTRKGKENSSK